MLRRTLWATPRYDPVAPMSRGRPPCPRLSGHFSFRGTIAADASEGRLRHTLGDAAI